MATSRTPGLCKRSGVWHIDKKILGRRICESTGTASLKEATLYLAKCVDQIRQEKLFGVRKQYTFEEASAHYVTMNKAKASIRDDIRELKRLHQYFAGQPLEAIHMGSLQSLINDRKKEGVKHRTINLSLQVIRQLLNQAATEWFNEAGVTWLAHAPKIKLLPQHDSRKPRPVSWDEQEALFQQLSLSLRELALFAVNTGCREQEICRSRWEWEVHVPEIGGSVFLLPGWFNDKTNHDALTKHTKTGEDRLVVLNTIAQEVIERQRGQHDIFVFTHLRGGQQKPYRSMYTTSWRNARLKSGLPDVRIHDLRHTFGRRLRSAGVGFEDRQDLLGHKSGRMTTHYSPAEIQNLLDAANSICHHKISTPTLRIIRAENKVSRKSPARASAVNTRRLITV